VSDVERPTLPEHFYLAQAPAGAIDVTAAHASVKDGDPIVVRGAVGGSQEPFVAGLSAFTIVVLPTRAHSWRTSRSDTLRATMVTRPSLIVTFRSRPWAEATAGVVATAAIVRQHRHRRRFMLEASSSGSTG